MAGLKSAGSSKEARTDRKSARFDEVYSREIDVINDRRAHLRRRKITPRVEQNLIREIRSWTAGWLLGGKAEDKSEEKEKIYARSVDYGLVGLALSGGGVRSASFCLGALQALDATSPAQTIAADSGARKKSARRNSGLLDRIDYMSTVSGGGYVGASVVAAMTSGAGEFPFRSELTPQEPPALKQVRDYSNFLIPNGITDVLGSAAVYLRGILTNIVVVLPWLLLFAALTILLNSNRAALSQPGPIGHYFAFLASYVVGPRFFQFFTISTVYAAVLAILLVIWGLLDIFVRPFMRKYYTGTTLVSFFGYALLVGVIALACEAQPFVLDAMFRAHDAKESIWGSAVETVQGVATGVAAIGALLGFFWRTFEGWVKGAAQDPRLRKRALAVLGKSAILVASVVVPFVLWLVYVRLAFWGIPELTPLTKLTAPAALQSLADTIVPGRAEAGGAWYKMLVLYLALAAVLLVLSWLFEPNGSSLHRLYRDRLSKAFLFDLSTDGSPKSLGQQVASYGVATVLKRYLAGKPLSQDLRPLDHLRLSQVSLVDVPYQLINSALNIQRSKYVNRRGRNADFFLFSPKFIGSVATGYERTEEMEKIDRDLDLATAMAISGAAASANMGSHTVRTMTPTLTFLNIRLGFWLRNPNWRSIRLRWLWEFIDWLNLYFFLEMFGWLHEDSWSVYVTDGGHVENLGIYELLKRECKLIIAVDAEADPEMNFPSFVKLERHARIDLGIIIDLPWRRLREVTLETGKTIADTGGPAHAETRKGPHCVIGRIQYPKGFGYLVYVKSSLTGDENDYIQDYKRRNDRFPHETTGDQFFSEEQFEVYRALGFHAMRSFLKGNEEVPTFEERRQEVGPTPPRYARDPLPASRVALNEIRALLDLPPLDGAVRKAAKDASSLSGAGAGARTAKKENPAIR